MRYTEFRKRLLVLLKEFDEKYPGDLVEPKTLIDSKELKFKLGWIEKATEDFENLGFVQAAFSAGPIDEGMDCRITGPGIEEAEVYEEDLGDSKFFVTGQPSTNPEMLVELNREDDAYKLAMNKLDVTIETVRGNNEYKDANPNDHEQRLAELQAGRLLLESEWVDISKVQATLFAVLTYLSLKFADVPIGEASQAAWEAVKALLGL